jgi:polyisoprenoid-binding protein YceI
MMPIKERWEIDAGNSQISFSLRHLVVSEIRGRFYDWGGEMILDPDDIPGARIKVWIDVASIDTGSVERDAHLRSAEFLDATRFPRAEFANTEIVRRWDGEAALTGRLLLHGITREVELKVIARKTWVDADGLMRATYSVQGTLDRQAFGLHWNQDLDVGGIVVGDKIEIQARVELVRSADSLALRGDAGSARPETWT